MERLRWIGLNVLLIIFLYSCTDSNSKQLEENNKHRSMAGQSQEQHPAYQRLQNALHNYETLKEKGGWKSVPASVVLQKGDSSEVVPEIRKRLTITGDLPKSEVKGNKYDQKLEEAVKKFQKRHGIKVDGIVGPETAGTMNIPVEDKIAKIEYSLKKWDNLPDTLENKYVIVNIPEFRLKTYENHNKKLDMKVIVGKEYNNQSTPFFQDQIEYIIFNPYWNIPHSIVEEDILPHAKNDINYLARGGYEMVNSFTPDAHVYNYSYYNLNRLERGQVLLRQKPGPNNALGTIKFMFPNRYAIYLHGTPAVHLFDKLERDFSHGCIRVEDPTALANYILENAAGKWNKDKIEKEIDNKKWRRVDLEEKVPVYIVYWTAFVDEDGTVNFRQDIYNAEA